MFFISWFAVFYRVHNWFYQPDAQPAFAFFHGWDCPCSVHWTGWYRKHFHHRWFQIPRLFFVNDNFKGQTTRSVAVVGVNHQGWNTFHQCQNHLADFELRYAVILQRSPDKIPIWRFSRPHPTLYLYFIHFLLSLCFYPVLWWADRIVPKSQRCTATFSLIPYSTMLTFLSLNSSMYDMKTLNRLRRCIPAPAIHQNFETLRPRFFCDG